MDARKIKTALISVFHKEGLEPLIRLLHQQGVQMLSTGGTYDFIVQQGLPCERVGRTYLVSVLSSEGGLKRFTQRSLAGYWARRPLQEDRDELIEYDIPTINLVITDLIPFRRYGSKWCRGGGHHREDRHRGCFADPCCRKEFPMRWLWFHRAATTITCSAF